MSDQPIAPTAPAAAPAAAATVAAPPTPSAPQPAPAPSAFPAPAAATWGQGASPVKPNKHKPAVIIAAASAAVFGLGGIFGLINLTKHESQPAPAPIAIGPTINPPA